MVRTVATAFLLLLLVCPIRAQAPSGEISGVVVDASGSPVPGVRITLVNQATNATRDVTTNGEGIYVLPVIPPGTYRLKAELSGFRSVERRDIELQVGSANRIPITLEIGDVSEANSVRRAIT